jgi:hypothetical protein
MYYKMCTSNIILVTAHIGEKVLLRRISAYQNAKSHEAGMNGEAELTITKKGGEGGKKKDSI